jgi:hypothetical protein
VTDERRGGDLLWLAIGGVFLAGLTLVIVRFYDERTMNERLAAGTQSLALVSHMRAALASSAEAEKSAVLALTDEDSRTAADRARALRTDLERARDELARLAARDGTQGERGALEEFSRTFDELRRIDDEILDLAVKNTNVKASALTYGPAADAVRDMGAALDRIQDRLAEPREASDGARAARLAARAEVAALRILALLPPHIAEQSDERMTALEARMTSEEQAVDADLDELRGMPALAADPDVTAAAAAWTRFAQLKGQIIALSRANTNVRSLDLSLNRKRAAFVAAENALAELQRAVEAARGGGTTSGRWAIPR